MEKQVNKVSCAKKQIIASLSLAAISLFLMIIDVCIEIYKFSKNVPAEEFSKGLTNMHIGFAAIELLSTIVILVLTSTTHCIFKKENMLNKSRKDLFICNWFFASLYIALSIVAATLLGVDHPSLVQEFLAGFSVVPMAAMTAVGGMMFTSFNK